MVPSCAVLVDLGSIGGGRGGEGGGLGGVPRLRIQLLSNEVSICSQFLLLVQAAVIDC